MMSHPTPARPWIFLAIIGAIGALRALLSVVPVGSYWAGAIFFGMMTLMTVGILLLAMRNLKRREAQDLVTRGSNPEGRNWRRVIGRSLTRLVLGGPLAIIAAIVARAVPFPFVESYWARFAIVVGMMTLLASGIWLLAKWNRNRRETPGTMTPESSHVGRKRRLAIGAALAWLILGGLVWSFIPLKRHFTFPRGHEAVRLSADPPGRLLTVHGPLRNQAWTLWEINTGKSLATGNLDGEAGVLAASPDLSFIICGGFYAETLKLFDTASSTLVKEFPDFNKWKRFNAFVFSPTGVKCAVAIRNGDSPVVEIWDLNQRVQSLVIPGAEAPLAFSPDGRSLATSDGKNQVQVVDAESGEVRESFPPPTLPLAALTYSKDGNHLAATARELYRTDYQLPAAEIRVYDLADHRPPTQLDTAMLAEGWVTFEDHDRLLRVHGTKGASGSTATWDLSTRPPTDPIIAIQPCISPDTSLQAELIGDETNLASVQIVTLATGNTVAELKSGWPQPCRLQPLCFSSDNQVLAVGIVRLPNLFERLREVAKGNKDAQWMKGFETWLVEPTTGRFKARIPGMSIGYAAAQFGPLPQSRDRFLDGSQYFLSYDLASGSLVVWKLPVQRPLLPSAAVWMIALAPLAWLTRPTRKTKANLSV